MTTQCGDKHSVPDGRSSRRQQIILLFSACFRLGEWNVRSHDEPLPHEDFEVEAKYVRQLNHYERTRSMMSIATVK